MNAGVIVFLLIKFGFLGAGIYYTAQFSPDLALAAVFLILGVGLRYQK